MIEIETGTGTGKGKKIANGIDVLAVARIVHIDIVHAAVVAPAATALTSTPTSEKTALLVINQAKRIGPAGKTGQVVAKIASEIVIPDDGTEIGTVIVTGIVIAILDDGTEIVSVTETVVVVIVIVTGNENANENEKRNVLDEIAPCLPSTSTASTLRATTPGVSNEATMTTTRQRQHQNHPRKLKKTLIPLNAKPGTMNVSCVNSSEERRCSLRMGIVIAILIETRIEIETGNLTGIRTETETEIGKGKGTEIATGLERSLEEMLEMLETLAVDG